MNSLHDRDPSVETADSQNRKADQGIRLAVNLYDESVVPTRPEFTVEGLIRKNGLHMVWAQPGAGKTYAVLRWMHELLMENPPTHLCGHPDLKINKSYKRVLWIGTEEDTGTLRWKGDKVLHGLGVDHLGGELMHIWSVAPGRPPVTLADLGDILEKEGPFDAVVLDPLT